MSKILSSCDNNEKCFCWNGDDDTLENCIRRNKFVKSVRAEIIKKKFAKKFKKYI